MAFPDSSGNVLVDDPFGGWDGVADSEAGDLVLWKTGIFVFVLALALVHALVLGPRIRRHRHEALTPEPGVRPTTRVRRLAVASAITQVAMLAGTLVILILAADLTT